METHDKVLVAVTDLDAMIADLERADPQYTSLEERGLLDRLRAARKTVTAHQE